MLNVRGATLAGMAAAARLARLGHQVQLITDGLPLGERWAARPGPMGLLVDDLPPVIALPAAWRDLFKKSGAHLVTALNAAGLELVPAPPATHLLRDGTTLELPAERGAQGQAIAAALGEGAARRWQRACAELERLWAAYRRHALEDVQPVRTATDRTALGLTRQLGDLASELGDPLADVLLRHGPATGPALAALPVAVERTFGRWQLVDAQGRAQRASLLVDLLSQRLQRLGVRVVAEATGPTAIDCRPVPPRGGWLRPAPPPRPRPEATLCLLDEAGGAAREVFEHATGRCTWLLPAGPHTLSKTLAGGEPDPSWGWALRNSRDWLVRPPIVGEPLRASACSPAGPEPWAELSSAALAVYQAHERITGQDCRPTNRDFKLPRLAR